ncbi:MAG: hypothetical protein Q4F49_10435 [Pseudoxanthomonas suwonensis]|nr:hypothetical protein [Pseudoxanthomonas suwonensis]
MSVPDLTALRAFLSRKRPYLAKIVLESRGLVPLEDLESQAWISATELSDEIGRPLNLDSEDDALLLLRAIGRFFGRQIRTGRKNNSFDAPIDGDDSPSYADILSADDDAHPLQLLEDLEAAPAEPPEPTAIDPYHSESAAWHWLAVRFDHRTRGMAEYLLISMSWCRERRKRALVLLESQQQLPHQLVAGEQEPALRPWRKFKLPPRIRTARGQLTLDFWSTPTQPTSGQLWLL